MIAIINSLNQHIFNNSHLILTVDVYWVETGVVDEDVVLEEEGVDVGVGVGVAEVVERSYQLKI